jgi:hypothetical protein
MVPCALFSLLLPGRFTQWLSGMLDNLHRAFLPDAKDVTPDYWEWLQWRLTQVSQAHPSWLPVYAPCIPVLCHQHANGCRVVP